MSLIFPFFFVKYIAKIYIRNIIILHGDFDVNFNYISVNLMVNNWGMVSSFICHLNSTINYES